MMILPHETFTALEAEIAALIDVLMEAFSDAETAADPDIVAAGIALYQTHVQEIGALAATAGLSGLHWTCTRFQEQLLCIARPADLLQNAHRELLEEWPGLTIGYLSAPTDIEMGEALVRHLQNPAWPAPLPEEEAAVLQAQLVAPWNAESVKEPEAVSVESAEVGVDRAELPVVAAQQTQEQWTLSPVTDAEAPLSPETAATTLLNEPEAALEEAETTDVARVLVEPEAALLEASAAMESALVDPVRALEEAVSVPPTQEVLEQQPPQELTPAIATTVEPKLESQLEPQRSWLDSLALPEQELDIAEAGPDQAEPPEEGSVRQAEIQAASVEMARSPAETAYSLWQQTATPLEQALVSSDEEEPSEKELRVDAGLLGIMASQIQANAAPIAESEVVDAVTEMEVEAESEPTPEPELEEAKAQSEPELEPEKSAEFSEAEQELVELLQAEMGMMALAAADLEAVATGSEGAAAARSEALMGYAESIARLADAANAMGFGGLQQACVCLNDNLLAFSSQSQPLTAGEYQLITTWLERALDYLQAVSDREVCQALVANLLDSSWPNPLPAEEADALLALLIAPKVALPEGEAETRLQEALPEHVSLALPEDVNPELLDSLLQELPDQTAELSAAIQRLAGGEGDLGDVDVAQRIAHTVKGAGNTVGVRGIANLTHHMEDILLAFSKHKTLPNRPLAEALLTAADCLETMSEALVGVSAPPSGAREVLQNILDWANRIDREGLPKGDEILRQPLRPLAPAEATEREAPVAPAARAEPVAAEAMVRVPASLVDELLRLVGESIILTGQIQERARKALRQTKMMQSHHQVFQQLTADLEQLVEIRGIAPLVDQATEQGDFDPLEMEKYNEFNTLTHRLLEAAADSRALDQDIRDDLTELDNLLVTQGRLHRSSQETVLRTRMIAVKTIAPRLQRSVRQTCRLTDKEVDFTISGGETLMDSNLLADITDPLMHVLRNAVDHGIELPARRQALGKEPVGRINLSFLREGDTIVVRCQDDGAGLNYAAILATARQRGFIAADATLGETELGQLILTAGFSTRSEATQVSGRGIGLDMVHTRIRELRGTFQIRSESNRGCLVELRLPVTLIAIHALMVRVHGQRFAISSRGVEQVLYAGLGEIRKLGAKSIYQVGDNFYELTALDALLDIEQDRRTGERHDPSLLLVREGTSGAIRAVLVQEVMDSRDLVVKPLARYFPKLEGIVGATILGDGSVVPVLDLPELLRAPLSGQAASSRVEAARPSAAPQPKRHLALVVDDSLSARRALAQAVEDAGYQVRTARDGLEAVAIMEAQRPDLLLVDLEMPRMNGLELTSHVRAREDTRHLPVIMVTS
ncbi:MAG: response regulator, partial [Candidatus Contendobacter sp.]